MTEATATRSRESIMVEAAVEATHLVRTLAAVREAANLANLMDCYDLMRVATEVGNRLVEIEKDVGRDTVAESDLHAAQALAYGIAAAVTFTEQAELGGHRLRSYCTPQDIGPALEYESTVHTLADLLLERLSDENAIAQRWAEEVVR